MAAAIDIPAGLAGRVALVTGGSRGIGAATAARLASHGALVGVGGRDQAAIDRVVDRIRADGGRAVPAPAEATDVDAVARAHSRLTGQFGPVELLAAFAGGNGRPRPTEAVEPEEWRRVIEGDLTTTFLTIRAALPAMIERGRGAIVTMSSAAGRQPSQAAAAYAAAKAGVAMLSKHLAAEMGPRGIRVNCLAPSAVLNEKMATAMTDEQRDHLAAAFPLGRLGQPDDVAAAAVFPALRTRVLAHRRHPRRQRRPNHHLTDRPAASTATQRPTSPRPPTSTTASCSTARPLDRPASRITSSYRVVRADLDLCRVTGAGASGAVLRRGESTLQCARR